MEDLSAPPDEELPVDLNNDATDESTSMSNSTTSLAQKRIAKKKSGRPKGSKSAPKKQPWVSVVDFYCLNYEINVLPC